MTMAEDKVSTQRKTCPGVTLPITNLTRNSLESNTSPSCKRPANDRPRHVQIDTTMRKLFEANKANI
jgi:hypothetical protein